MRSKAPVGLTIVGASTFFLAAALTLGSYNAQASEVDCKTLNSNSEIRACLEAFAKTQLEKDSPAGKLFSDRLNRMLNKYRLIGAQVKTESLADSFSIYVDESPQLKDGNSSARCFDFEKLRSQRAKAQLIENIKGQVVEVAKFLAMIHASSFGHQVSLLFPIREVSICSAKELKDRALSFEQRSLHVGLNGAPTASDKLLESWNSGNPMRSTELTWYSHVPLLGGFLRKFTNRDNPELILRDKIADNWVFLNPTGNIRTTALYTLAEAIFAIKSGLGRDQNPIQAQAVNGNQNHAQDQGQAQNSASSQAQDSARMYSAMAATMRGPGFSQEEVNRLEQISQDPVALAGLYNLWQQKIYSPHNILTVIENAIGDQANKSQNLHVAMRKIKGINLSNDKNIIIRLEQLMANSIPVSKFSESAARDRAGVEVSRTRIAKGKDGTETTEIITIRGENAQDVSINADEIDSILSINLIDNIVISLQVPNISAQTYRRVSLHQALSEILTDSVIPQRR